MQRFSSWVRDATTVGLLALVLPLVRVEGQVPDSSYKSTSNDTLPKRTFGGFVDTYYAWDFDRPHTFDRVYTTQPARHAEFPHRPRFTSDWAEHSFS
jgi:hypothetical protein